MPSLPAVITPPTRLPKQPFVTEAQLAHLVRVTPETLRAWRKRGEMPPVAGGSERDEFCRGLKVHGRWPVCYRISDISAWLFGTGGQGGRPAPLPASAWDAVNDQTMQLRRAGQAAKNAGDAKQEARARRLLTQRAKFAAKLGFSSPTAYENWIAHGAPLEELPNAPIVDAIEPDELPELIAERIDQPRRRPTYYRSPWEALAQAAMAEEPEPDPFSQAGRAPKRRGPVGYFSS
jgi:hypothetical protein